MACKDKTKSELYLLYIKEKNARKRIKLFRPVHRVDGQRLTYESEFQVAMYFVSSGL